MNFVKSVLFAIAILAASAAGATAQVIIKVHPNAPESGSQITSEIMMNCRGKFLRPSRMS